MDREKIMYDLRKLKLFLGEVEASISEIEKIYKVAMYIANGKEFPEVTIANIKRLKEIEMSIDELEDFIRESVPSSSDTPYYLKDLNLSTRAYNVLKGAGIKTVPELLEIPEMQFVQFMDANGHKIRNMGNVVLGEILSTLKEFNLSFKN